MSEREREADDVRAELEQLRDRVETLETTVADEQGREWSVPKLVSEFGLSRRQALIAAGFVAGGMGLFPALARAIGDSENYGSSSGIVGTESTPLKEVNAKRGHFRSVQVDALLEAEQVSHASLTDGTMSVVRAFNTSSGRLVTAEAQPTEDISTTATVIASNNNGAIRCARTTVWGVDDTDVSTAFIDEVWWGEFGNVRTEKHDARGTPAVRTYGINGGSLELTMGSGTYDVTTLTLRFDPIGMS